MYYFAGAIKDDEVLTQYQSDICTNIYSRHNTYQKPNIHLTVVNQIKLPSKYEHKVSQALQDLNINPIDILVTGVSVWPSISKPRAIVFDVEASIKPIQTKIVKILSDYNGTVVTELPSPHITICKTSNYNGKSKRFVQQLRNIIQTEVSIQTQVVETKLYDKSF